MAVLAKKIIEDQNAEAENNKDLKLFLYAIGAIKPEDEFTPSMSR